MITSSRRPEFNGILAFIPEGGDEPDHIPSGLLLPNA